MVFYLDIFSLWVKKVLPNLPYYSLKGNYPVRYMVSGCNPLEFDYTILGPIVESWRSSIFEQSKTILEENINNFEAIYFFKGGAVYKLI